MLDIDKFADTGQLFDNHYKLIRPLNTDGGTADVWLALDKSTVRDKSLLDEAPFFDDATLNKLGLLVAIKIYKPKNALDIEGERRFREEFMIVFNCNHANLVHPVYFSIFRETPYLVLPYCRRGSSETMVGNFTNDKDIWKFIRDVSAGLAYLHQCKPTIIHQDIKPANVLIDDNGNYAITDFGISAKRIRQTKRNVNAGSLNQEDEDDDTTSGTFAYMAPERFVENATPSTEGDIWAFGATLYELITGQVPFGDDGGYVQPDGKVQLSYEGIKISDSIKRLISDCLAKDPLQRPSAARIASAAAIGRYSNHRTGKINPKKLIPEPSSSSGKGKGLLTWLLVSVLSLSVLAGGLYYFMSRNEDEENTDNIAVQAPPSTHQSNPTISELFNDAMKWTDASTRDSVDTGLKKLEKLANDSNYIPALYELAITYGGEASDDEMAFERKRILGIKLGNDNLKYDGDGDFIPHDNRYNEKAIALYSRIVDLSNPNYDEINMKSAFRLGFYYLYLKDLKQESVKYFKAAEKIAVRVGDDGFEEDSRYYIDEIGKL